MPALPWLAVGTPDPDADLIVMASRLSLRSHGDIPRFLRHTWLIRRQLVRSPGLIGYSLDAHLLAKTFWTVSAWQSRPEDLPITWAEVRERVAAASGVGRP